MYTSVGYFIKYLIHNYVHETFSKHLIEFSEELIVEITFYKS